MPANSSIIIAMDYSDMSEAMAMASQLNPDLCRVKVGKELFTSAGPAVVIALQEAGFDVFLDLKFHDIPSTTCKSVVAAARLGVWMINVHASGGQRMMTACREALDNLHLKCPPKLIAVTVLTSMEELDLAETGIDTAPEEQVKRLAMLAKTSGMDGVVCSAKEAALLRNTHGKDFLLVTPGIRPASLLKEQDDQRRIITPKEAGKNGSDYLVIGRPVTQADDPIAALKTILLEI